MTFAVQGRTLPTTLSNYPATVEGVEGYVVSISGNVCFVDHAQADAFARSILFDEDRTTQPVEIQTPIPRKRE